MMVVLVVMGKSVALLKRGNLEILDPQAEKDYQDERAQGVTVAMTDFQAQEVSLVTQLMASRDQKVIQETQVLMDLLVLMVVQVLLGQMASLGWTG
jgi:hypothetical protein